MASKSRLGLHQRLLTKLSPQQIQLMKLLQLPVSALEERIQAELEANPALEEGRDEGGLELGDLGDLGDSTDEGGEGDAGEVG
ncbi:MAG: RNA polymerase sigma-54 factor, partial [Bacteroidota bacterium]